MKINKFFSLLLIFCGFVASPIHAQGNGIPGLDWDWFQSWQPYVPPIPDEIICSRVTIEGYSSPLQIGEKHITVSQYQTKVCFEVDLGILMTMPVMEVPGQLSTYNPHPSLEYKLIIKQGEETIVEKLVTPSGMSRFSNENLPFMISGSRNFKVIVDISSNQNIPSTIKQNVSFSVTGLPGIWGISVNLYKNR